MAILAQPPLFDKDFRYGSLSIILKPLTLINQRLRKRSEVN